MNIKTSAYGMIKVGRPKLRQAFLKPRFIPLIVWRWWLGRLGYEL